MSSTRTNLPARNLNRQLTLFSFALLLLTVTGSISLADINHAKFQAKQVAFASFEGPNPFTLREEWRKGTIEPGEADLVKLQLFSKNDYQFWFAIADVDGGVLLNIYDSKGKLLSVDTVKYPGKSNVASVVFSPEKTDFYYLRLALTEEVKVKQDWALIYAYR